MPKSLEVLIDLAVNLAASVIFWLGLGLIVLILLGGRYVRRMGKTDKPSTVDKQAWYAKPLVPPPDEEPPAD